MAKVTRPSAPDHLTMNLFAPGMTALHRAGLGGLACTLKAVERQHEAGLLRADKLPGPVADGVYPWDITDDAVTLKFGKPELAGDYLKKLFAFGFQIRDGVIFLPGQYGDVPPSTIVLAAIQDGIQNTFLQHGPTCGSRDGERTDTIEIDGTPISVTYDVFTSYKHQGWFWLDRDQRSKEQDPITGKKTKTGERAKIRQALPVVGEDGALSGQLHEIDIKLLPGGMVRHNRFNQSAIRETDAGVVCLHFGLIGCLTLSINRVTAVLLIPEVHDLLTFAFSRKFLTPRTARDCRIAGAADAALQAQVRIRASREAFHAETLSCHAITCRPTQWNAKQKPRVLTTNVPVGSDVVLDKFERALHLLPPRLVVPRPPEQTAKRQTKTKPKDPFWSDSIVRPLIADNLALDRPWYAGFTMLTTAINYDKQGWFIERKGLHAMIAETKMWDQDGERLVVEAVHQAMRRRMAQILSETDGEKAKFATTATKNRWKGFRGRLRISLRGAKKEEDVRFALMDLFSRAGNVPALREGWQSVLPVIRRDWHLARDLGLLALASYVGKGETGASDQLEPTTPTEEQEP